jgi:hypothetical protein
MMEAAVAPGIGLMRVPPEGVASRAKGGSKSRSRSNAVGRRAASGIAPKEIMSLAAKGAENTLLALKASDTEPVQSKESDITQELLAGGPALGSFVKAVGLAVAESQTKLDETFIKTAQALSNQQIDVIAVFEQEIDDNGQMTAGKAHVQKLPAVNFLAVPSHQFTRVHMQAEMKVSEFNSANGMNIRGGSTSFKMGAKGSVNQPWNASAEIGFSTNSYNHAANMSASRDEAAGSLQLDATIEARPEIFLPKPLLVQKGPRLKVIAGARKELKNGDGKPVGREVEVILELRGHGNNPLTGKRIEYKVGDSRVNYTVTPNDGVTAGSGNGDGVAEGTLKLVLRREGAMFDPAKPPEPVPVNVWFGLVSESIALEL